MAPSFMPEWAQSQLVELAAKQPFGHGRVSLGLAFDGYFLPKDEVVALFEQVRGPLGLKLITSHYVRNTFFGRWRSWCEHFLLLIMPKVPIRVLTFWTHTDFSKKMFSSHM